VGSFSCTFPGGVEIVDGATLQRLTGIMYFSFNFYKLIPRYNSDFVGYTVVGIEEEETMPKEYSLNQNYPNPFNPSTTISYSIPKEGNVVLKIYNVLGQEVKVLVNHFQSAGSYKVNFDAGSLTSGIYFYSINSENFSQVKKMMLIK
jgi:hypothetical protein